MSDPETLSSTMLPVELTLILAATRNMGIGRAGGLPWTGLKKEMAYFARVTKRLPSDVSLGRGGMMMMMGGNEKEIPAHLPRP